MNNVSFINQIKGIKNTLWQQMKKQISRQAYQRLM
jgi:hypothetical protein